MRVQLARIEQQVAFEPTYAEACIWTVTPTRAPGDYLA